MTGVQPEGYRFSTQLVDNQRASYPFAAGRTHFMVGSNQLSQSKIFDDEDVVNRRVERERQDQVGYVSNAATLACKSARLCSS